MPHQYHTCSATLCRGEAGWADTSSGHLACGEYFCSKFWVLKNFYLCFFFLLLDENMKKPVTFNRLCLWTLQLQTKPKGWNAHVENVVKFKDIGAPYHRERGYLFNTLQDVQRRSVTKQKSFITVQRTFLDWWRISFPLIHSILLQMSVLSAHISTGLVVSFNPSTVFVCRFCTETLFRWMCFYCCASGRLSKIKLKKKIE